MWNLIFASLLWAFSFGLIKGRLAGLDPTTVAASRLLLAALVFSPFLGQARLDRLALGKALGLGAVQFGIMYWLYIASYGFLPAWLVALFTVFTPLYVVLLTDAMAGRARWRNVFAALLAVLGALVVVVRQAPGQDLWKGVLLLQGANLCFATGQSLYPKLKSHAGEMDVVLVGWMYWGAFLFTGLLVALGGGPDARLLNPAPGLTVLYLGLAPTALGFYLWNRGAARVGSGSLAVANNLKVPLAVLVSWLVFGEVAAYGRATLGLAIILGSLWLVNKKSKKTSVY